MGKKLAFLLCLVILSFALLAGCAQNVTRSSSSLPLSNMIEPVKDSKFASQKKPLNLPVSVAIVTVPGNSSSGKQVPETTLRLAAEKLKQQLQANTKYVSSVSVVEKDDLPGKIPLEKIRSIYAADIAIVLSYQQDQRSSQSGVAGLMDATIVGMFLVPGVGIKTTSVIDGKVIHIPSNAIIFRASGMDERSTHSTSYAHLESFTEDSINSLIAATTDFGNSLNKTISKFDNYDLSKALPLSDLTASDAAAANDYWHKVNTYKSTGGGAFGLLPLLISVAICFAAWRRR